MRRKRWNVRYLILLCVLALAACSPVGVRQSTTTQHALAQDGGTRLTLRASCLPAAPACDLTKQRDAAIAALTRRISRNTSVLGAVVRTDGATNIVVELPGISDDAQIMDITKLLTDVGGKVEILDASDAILDTGASVAGKTCVSACDAGQYRVVFTGDQMDPGQISVQQDTQHTGVWLVEFAFAGAAKKQFAEYTASHIGQPLVITLNDVVISSPTIQSEIDEAGEISGLGEAEARQIANDVRLGALPVALTLITTEHVAPTGA